MVMTGVDKTIRGDSAAHGDEGVPAIVTRHLTKRYGKARGIADVDLTVGRGEVFGFVGPNGAGKSTTIRCLLGLIRPTGGSASIFGLDCVRDRVRILENVGYLPSEVFYYEGMRARDLLAYAASFYHRDCSERITELSERLGLNLDQKIEDMSLGNRKKVGIVQGLLHSPKLVILDEPTSGLDPLAQRAFFDLIREENREHGVTVLFSSHILSEVQRMCDRVAIIREGRIVTVKDVAELRRSSVKRVSLVLGGSGVRADGDDGARPVGVSGAIRDEHADSASASIEAILSGLAGVRSLTAGDGASEDVSFLFEGDCNGLLRTLAGLDLADVSITEPTLEEVFMHYYQPADDAEPGKSGKRDAADDAGQLPTSAASNPSTALQGSRA